MTRRVHREGEVFTQADFVQWVTLAPMRGDVLVVNLGTSSYQAVPHTIGYFLVLEVHLIPGTGTLAVRAKSLGSSDTSLNKDLSLRFNRKQGWLHFCSSNPCIEEHAGDIHVADVVWHSLAGVEDQLSPTTLRSARKWLSETEESYWPEEDEMTHPEAGEHPGPGDVEETSRPSALRRPMEAEKPGDGDLGSAGSVGPGKVLQRDPQVLSGQVRPRAPKRVADRSKGSGQLQRPVKRPAAADGVGVSSKESKGKGVGSLDRPASALPPEKVQKLHDELQRSKAKLAGGGPPDPPPEGDSPGGEDGSGSGSSDYTGSGSSGSAEEAGLGAGTLLTRDPTRTQRTLHQKALSGGTSEGFHEQLIRRAAGSTPRHSPKETDKDKHNNEKKESGKHHKRGHSGGRKSDKEDGKKEKKKKKKKKKSKRHAKRKKKERKKKKTKVTLSDGRIISCSSSSSDSSRTPSSTEDEKALEAPLKKKSLKEPGSVLNMLLEHISVQLQQNAEVDTPVTRHGDLTSGVKVMTYLSLIIKPQFPNRPKEMRELHMLASTIDLLRQGQLAKLGDVLAGRLVAIHQSLLDASWVSARHLEVLPMPEGAALADGVLLAARKHGRQVTKAQDAHAFWPTGKGRGKGSWWKAQDGESDWAWRDTKGKGKKGKKGKGKAKKDKEAHDVESGAKADK